MRYDDEEAPLIFDTETVSIDGAAGFLEPVSAPANYKDPVKIDAYIAEKTTERAERCALDVDLARIVAIGWRLVGRDTEPRVLICKSEDEERYALSEFWRDVEIPGYAVRKLITFNGLRFDCPLVMRRSLYLGVNYCWLNVDKYRTDHIDLCDRLSYRGAINTHSLDFYCKRFALDVPADDVSGKDIQALVAAENWAAIENHCRVDVQRTAALAVRIGVIKAFEPEPLEAA